MSRLGAVLRVTLLAALPLVVGPASVWGASNPGIPNIAIDTSGNLYVASTSTNAHLVINKYDPAGTPATSPFPLDLGAGTRLDAIITDSRSPGNLYVAYTTISNVSGAELKVTKYDSTGALVYAPPYQIKNYGATNRLEGILTDSAGDLFVAWTNNQGILSLDKFEPGGNQIYTRQAPGTQLNGMMVDTSFNLYVCRTPSDGNLTIARYDATGTQSYSKPLGIGGQFNGFVQDNAGNVFISWISAAAHLLIEKYDVNGVQTFSKDLGAGNRPGPMALDLFNNVFIAWTSTAGHLFLNKYTSAGVPSASLDQGFGSQFASLAVDPTNSYFISYVSSTANLIIQKYNSADTPATPLDLGVGTQLNGMTVDFVGALYAFVTPTTTGNLLAKRWDASNTPIYTKDLLAGSQYNGAAVDGSSNLYIEYTSSTGHLKAARYGFTGTPAYTNDLDLGLGTRSSGAVSNVTGNLVDPAGYAYLTSIDSSGSTQTVAKYGLAGGAALHTRSGTPYTQALTAVDGFGNSYVASVNSSITLEKRNAADGTI